MKISVALVAVSMMIGSVAFAQGTAKKSATDTKMNSGSTTSTSKVKHHKHHRRHHKGTKATSTTPAK